MPFPKVYRVSSAIPDFKKKSPSFAINIILGFLIGEEEAIRGMSGVGMFPLLIGAAYVGLWVFIGRKEPVPLV